MTPYEKEIKQLKRLFFLACFFVVMLGLIVYGQEYHWGKRDLRHLKYIAHSRIKIITLEYQLEAAKGNQEAAKELRILQDFVKNNGDISKNDFERYKKKIIYDISDKLIKSELIRLFNFKEREQQ